MQNKNFKSITTVIVINILSWYEFAIYITLSPIIAKLFFPVNFELQKSPFYTLLIASLTFVARIIGGLFFGRMADRESKSKALMYSVILMSIATISIAFLPSHESIGYSSLAILICIRLIQAFCLGGEFGSSIAYLMQIAPHKRIGLYGAIPMVGMGIGLLFANITSYIINSLPKEFIYDFGWKIPFLIAGLSGVVSLYLRKNSRKIITNQTKAVLNIKQHRKEISWSIGIFSCSMFHLYLFCILIKVVMLSHNVRISNLLYILIILTFIIFAFVGGTLSENKYCKQIFIVNILLLPLYTILVFIFHYTNILILASISVGILQGMIPKMLYNNLPKQYLATTLSLVNNLTAVIFGSALVVVLQHFSVYSLVIASLGLVWFSFCCIKNFKGLKNRIKILQQPHSFLYLLLP